MRIAFDLDDTLVPTTQPFSVGSQKSRFPLRWVFREELRLGAIDLLRWVSEQHELWIYTSSLRSTLYIKAWFFGWGIRVKGVVNYREHQDSIAKHPQYLAYTKAPMLFGIDLLIDDSAGVEIECQQQGCPCFIVDKDDCDWVASVRCAIDELGTLPRKKRQ